MNAKRQLLEAAAKAAGYHYLTWCEIWEGMAEWSKNSKSFDFFSYWNPLEDYSDAFKLMLDMGISVEVKELDIKAYNASNHRLEKIYDYDYKYTATAWAIVQLAAGINKEDL